MMCCMGHSGNKVDPEVVLAFKEFIVKRINRFSFSNIQAL